MAARRSLAKRPRLAPLGERHGRCLAMGSNDASQLGLGEDLFGMDVDIPRAIKHGLPEKILMVACGGMHSVALDREGNVYSWGCNDNSQLGRNAEEEAEHEPRRVDLDEKAVFISAGDMHSAALTESGRVFVWGVFRDVRGEIGISPESRNATRPVLLVLSEPVQKISSGENHLVILSRTGKISTFGAADGGVLGRVREGFTSSEAVRHGRAKFLTPAEVRPNSGRSKRPVFSDIWAGVCACFALASNGEVFAWGLNNTSQLAKPLDPEHASVYFPERVSALKCDNTCKWRKIGSNLTNCIGLDAAGRIESCDCVGSRVYTWGARHYGYLGLGEDFEVSEEENDFHRINSFNPFATPATPVGKGRKSKAPSSAPSTSRVSSSAEQSASDDSVSDGSMNMTAMHRAADGVLNAQDPARAARNCQSLPRHVSSLPPDIVDIAAGGSCFYAVDKEGHLFSWGGACAALGHGEEKNEDDIWEPCRLECEKLHSGDRKVFQVSGGGQHCCFLLDMGDPNNNDS